MLVDSGLRNPRQSGQISAVSRLTTARHAARSRGISASFLDIGMDLYYIRTILIDRAREQCLEKPSTLISKNNPTRAIQFSGILRVYIYTVPCRCLKRLLRDFRRGRAAALKRMDLQTMIPTRMPSAGILKLILITNIHKVEV